MKCCTHCGEEKPRAEFYAHHTTKDGLRPECKRCKKKRTVETRRVRREEGRDEAEREWVAANPERRRATSRRWEARNRDLRRKRSENARRANPQLHRERVRRWRERNREHVRAYKRAYYKRHREAHLLKVRNQGGDATAREYVAVLLRDPCSYCNGTAGTIDHIEASSKGGSSNWANLTPACAGCNSTKRTKPLLVHLLKESTSSTP